MATDAKKSNLLYIADNGTNDVYVYSYPRGKLMGTLAGFNSPGGMCVDKAGNIFISNVFGWNVLEYAHGGTSPIAIFNEGKYSFPVGCSVDTKTGKLAVVEGASGGPSGSKPSGTGPGQLLIYNNASGTPTSHGAMYYPYSCGYDPDGNLFVDGEGPVFPSFQFGELPKGGTKFKNIALNQAISLPGGVQWDGSNIAVGDVYNSSIYQFVISGKQGTEVGSTPLTGSDLVWQFWIHGSQVVAPNVEWISSQDFSNVLFYPYPSGGAATKILSGTFNDPVGVTVSRAPK